MPFSTDNIVQYNTGTTSGASGGGSATITLPNATTAGTAIVVCTYAAQDNTQGSGGAEFGSPFEIGEADFLSSSPSGGVLGRLVVYIKRNGPGGETSWSADITSNDDYLGAWAAFEISEVVGASVPTAPGSIPADWWCQLTGGGSIGDPTATVSSDTTGFAPSNASTTTECFETLGIATFGANVLSGTPPTISGYTDGFFEYTQVSLAGSTNSIAMAVAFRSILDFGRFHTTASVSPNAYMCSDLACLYREDGKFAQIYEAIFGAEIGTASGLTSGSIAVAGTAPFDGSAGSPEIVTTFARTGSYSLKLSSTSAAENVTWTNTGVLGVLGNPSSVPVLTDRFHIYFDGSLPGSDLELASTEAGSAANGMVVRYRSASGKIGVQVGTGTEVLSDAAISANKWIGIDRRYFSSGTTHTCDWQVDYDSLDPTAGPVAQSRASNTGMTWTSITTVRYGWTTSSTATAYFDDIAASKRWGPYPLGDVRVVGLKVDPAGTPTISGTSTNFEVFTSNGNGSAWNAANARNAVDDIPPTVGASADGVMQVAVAASDYAEFPMATFTAAPDSVLRGVRWYVAGWAASGNPGTLKVVSNDGTVDLFIVALADHGFDTSSLVWLCGMQRQHVAGVNVHYPLTQAKLDALALRVGFSTDANPDVGIHAILAELAYAPALVIGTTEAEGGAFKVYIRQDAISGAHASYLGTTPAGTRGMTMYGTIGGSDWSQYVDPNSTGEKIVAASSVDDVTAGPGLTVDPTE